MDKLRAWLELTGKTPSELSRSIGASPNSVANWLAGRSTPRIIFLKRLHERTGIALEDLLPEDDAA